MAARTVLGVLDPLSLPVRAVLDQQENVQTTGLYKADVPNLLDYMPKSSAQPGDMILPVEPLPSVGHCSSCSTSVQQLARANFLADEACSQLTVAESSQREVQSRLQASQIAVAALKQERSVLEDSLRHTQQELEERKSACSSAEPRWRDEVAAWQALCQDANAAAEAARNRGSGLEARKVSATMVVSDLQCQLRSAKEAVASAHTAQSNMEAQRIHKAGQLDAELRRLRAEESEAHVRISKASNERGEAETTLEKHRAQGVDLDLALGVQRQRAAELEREVELARQEAEAVRAQCGEVRDQCRESISSLNAIEQRRQSRCDRACSPCHVLDESTLRRELDESSVMIRKMRYEIQSLRSWRLQASEHRQATVVKLRGKVRRYRAECENLRYSQAAASFPDMPPRERSSSSHRISRATRDRRHEHALSQSGSAPSLGVS